MDVIRDWFKRYFSDPQVVILISVLVVSFVVILSIGDLVAPVLTSIVVAYLLQGPIKWLEKIRVPSSLALIIVFLCFIVLMVLILVWLVPTMLQEVPKFFTEYLPTAIRSIKVELVEWVNKLDNKHAGEASKQAGIFIDNFDKALKGMGQKILASSWDSVKLLINAVVFIVLMPMLVYFFLKDKKAILEWMRRFYPKNMELTNSVWYDLNEQIGNYIRGKIFEVLLVWVITYVAFLSFGMQYAFLLAAMVGLSALIPYIGAVIVTIPVVIFAYTGFLVVPDALNAPAPDYSSFWGVIIVYLVIQAVDGVVVVPLLFSEVVKLHPIAIVMAVLVFGGLWGFWGVFFAIPLASLVQAILNAWPRTAIVEQESKTS
ncbi:Putative permease PerM (= YfgO) [hydrothermal vent metagenome]|uniref:Permease PerM (= YfgO) n=1 Tax=hydrothermal vent metagenome TaxID=652676 RepID=A0A3B0YQA5_9ZZZZ